MKKQLKIEDESTAKDAAKIMSKEVQGTGYACVILSNGIYWVENEPAFVRNFETLVAEYEAGEIIKH